MNILVILLLILTIFIETAQQLFFKLAGTYPKKYYLYCFLGIVMYLIFVMVWFRVLKDLPLSFALPIMGLNYVAVALASSLLLKEIISLRRWGGIFLILFGMVLVMLGGGSFL